MNILTYHQQNKGAFIVSATQLPHDLRLSENFHLRSSECHNRRSYGLSHETQPHLKALHTPNFSKLNGYQVNHLHNTKFEYCISSSTWWQLLCTYTSQQVNHQEAPISLTSDDRCVLLLCIKISMRDSSMWKATVHFYPNVVFVS